MTGGGTERPAIGLGLGALAPEGDDQWAIARHVNGNWSEVERLGSEQKAQERLDELAATEGVPLEDLRIRRVDD
jgi:hypothetical protein